MTPEWIAAVGGFLTLVVLGLKTLGKLDEIKRSLGGRLADSIDTTGREQRAIGKLEGGQDERADHQAELERARVHSLLVTELPSQERRTDGAE